MIIQKPTSIFELIKEVPNLRAKIGQRYSNHGTDSSDRNHYPLFYKGTNIVEYMEFDNTPIPTKIIINNPDYFVQVDDNSTNESIIEWLHDKGVDCDEFGIIHTRLGNTVNLLEIIKDC